MTELTARQRATSEHYQEHPFDFLTAEDETRIAQWQPPPFRHFVARYVRAGDFVADMGCGPGRATTYLAWVGVSACGLDLSPRSIALAQRRAPNSTFVCASNLALPFGDGAFEAVVSDGVIHHTPDPRTAFRENSRVLKAGGYMYLGVYNRRRYYFYLYTYVGIPVRWLERRRWGRVLVNATLLPLYYGVHLVKSRGQRTWRGARNFFYDYIITPVASFHDKSEIESWAADEGLQLLEYFPDIGNVHAFIFRKS